MLMPDVNVLVYAHRVDAVDHERYRQWLEDLARGSSTYAMSDLVLSGFVRVMTSTRIFPDADAPDQALLMVRRLRDRANCRPLTPGPRHWGIFTQLCQQAGARGNLVSDAYHAAIAIEHGCEWVTTDRDFSRFPGLRWHHPLDA